MNWLRALTRRFWIGPTTLLTRYAEELRRAPATGGWEIRGFIVCLRSFPFGKELGRPGLLRSADVTSKAKGWSSVPVLSG